MGMEDAATIPIVFLTAHYALNHLGRMQAGERVLIHAAAGGVGMAALQLAQRAGAEVFATAGSPEKRALLESLGVRHVMDSRSLDFAGEVLRRTGGEGVDLVLNSLAGEAIPKSLSVLRPYGRFLEIGKRDIYGDMRLSLLPFQKSLSYFAIDLDRMFRDRPAFVGGLFREVMRGFQEGTLRPIPRQSFPVSRVAEAFRHMALARHTGKIVLTLKDEAACIEPARPGLAVGTYLVTGGLGGLGLVVAGFLAEQGARRLVLAGRRPPGAEAEASLAALRAAGVEIKVVQGDVRSPQDVVRMVAESETVGAPLKGVVHAAGVLEDATLLSMDAGRLEAAMAPKVAGAFNLHVATARHSLDFFVLFSSVASFMGFPGQGNYAAGNAFLDALARHRRAHGQPGQSIQWGPWARVGLAAAEANRGARLASRGLRSLTPQDGLRGFEVLLRERPVERAVMLVEWKHYLSSSPAAAASPFFALVAPTVAASAVGPSAEKSLGVREELTVLEAGPGRRARFERYLRDQVAEVLRLAPSRIDLGKPLRTLGLDSLMALELRNRLEAGLGLTLPATLVWNYPTITVLVPHLAGRMGLLLEAESEEPAPAPGPPADVEPDEVTRILGEIEQLSAEQARRLLAGEP
jgi:NADPH:quinone reductase-like Zn-dependent oxidoreductase/acyl carrier protein